MLIVGLAWAQSLEHDSIILLWARGFSHLHGWKLPNVNANGLKHPLEPAALRHFSVLFVKKYLIPCGPISSTWMT
eukprot:scaffold201572_cov35-Attheya_sp.AAC.2